MPFDSHTRISKRTTRLAMLLTAAASLALLLSPQPPALANGVHFDPESPAGKEYALPLDQAREEAAGVGKSDGPAGEKAPLFGEGVSSGGSGGASGGGGSGTSGGSSDGGGSTGGQAAGSPRPPASAAAAASAAAIAGDGDGYAFTSAILWVAAIVALGAVAGLALRGLQRPRHP